MQVENTADVLAFVDILDKLFSLSVSVVSCSVYSGVSLLH